MSSADQKNETINAANQGSKVKIQPVEEAANIMVLDI